MAYIEINGTKYMDVVDSESWTSKRQIITEKMLNIPGVQMVGRTMSEYDVSVLAPHVHSKCMEIVYVVSGSQQYQIYGKDYIVNGNQLFITPPNVPHSSGDKPHGRYEIYMLKLYAEYKNGFLSLTDSYGRLLHSAVLSLRDTVISPLENLKPKFDKAFYHLSQSDLLENMLGRTILQELLLDICTSVHEERAKLSPMISSAVNFINQNLYEEISLEELAFYCSLSLSRFKQKFREETGVSPREYINIQKIERAKELLKSGKNITDTAFDLSFSSSNYFSVVFKKVTGLSPREYIKGIK